MASTIYNYWLSMVRSFFNALGFAGKEGTLLVLGLDNAGKTTLLQRLKTGSIRNYPPTDRPNLTEKFQHQGITFNAWDLGGHEAVRHLWTDYAPECKALLFVIDAADAERLEEAGYELDALVADQILHALPIAVMLNKCDLPQARPSVEVMDKIQFAELQRMHSPGEMRIFRISVLKGEGYQQALEWIATFL